MICVFPKQFSSQRSGMAFLGVRIVKGDGSLSSPECGCWLGQPLQRLAGGEGPKGVSALCLARLLAASCGRKP